jgi:methionyl-tRNA formyltransferase
LAYHLLKPDLLKHQTKIYYSESVGGTKEKDEALVLLESYEKTIFFNHLPRWLHENSVKTEFEFFDDQFSSAPIQLCTKVNDPDFLAEVRSFEPDLFISIRFGKIFQEEIIRIPKKGVLNLHSGILPDYRGILGTLHALREGRKAVGCTLHYIPNHTIDTGDIIDVAYLRVQSNRTLFWHIVNLYPPGCQMISTALRNLESVEHLPTQVQDPGLGNYYSLPTREHFLELRERGFEVITLKDYGDFLKQWISSDLDMKHFDFT